MPELPASEQDVADAVADALRAGERLTIVGGGSKAAVGAPEDARPLPMTGLAGVVDYDPAELVLTVRPGTPLAEVQALLASQEQMFAFDPFDHGPIFGEAAGKATIGGIVAAGVSGSQRLSGFAVRDHLLGLRAVSGRAEIFVAGGKVVKNVTGFDLPKLAAGSWGRLFALTELTLKVLPRPRESVTMAIRGLDAQSAIAVMSGAMGSQAEVAAAGHIPAELFGRESWTLLRVQGFGPSVAARLTMLEAVLASSGTVRTLVPDDAASVWDALRTLTPLGRDLPIWRINLAPSGACAFLASLAPERPPCLFDWAGALLWLACGEDPVRIRSAAEAVGGHATLVRADREVRARVPAFHPPAPAVAALETQLRRAFDPSGVFETRRF